MHHSLMELKITENENVVAADSGECNNWAERQMVREAIGWGLKRRRPSSVKILLHLSVQPREADLHIQSV